MEFKRTTVDVTIYGDKYAIRRPTVGEVEKVVGVLSKKHKKDDAPIVKKFIADLGLPIDVIDEMEFPHLEELLEVLTTTKKKLTTTGSARQD